MFRGILEEWVTAPSPDVRLDWIQLPAVESFNASAMGRKT